MIMTRKFELLTLASLAFIATIKIGSPLAFVAGSCKEEDISVVQGQDTTGGIPKYRVEIVNNCVSGCAPSRIHFHCGWFSSADLINPGVFKRLAYDDCLVNDGKPLENGAILSFYYSNTFMYPLSLKSASFC